MTAGSMITAPIHLVDTTFKLGLITIAKLEVMHLTQEGAAAEPNSGPGLHECHH